MNSVSSRRGTATLVVADNVKTFKAASSMLKELFEDEMSVVLWKVERLSGVSILLRLHSLELYLRG